MSKRTSLLNIIEQFQDKENCGKYFDAQRWVNHQTVNHGDGELEKS